MPPVREEATDVPRSRLLVLSSALAAALALGGCSPASDDAAVDQPASTRPAASSTTATTRPADAAFPEPGGGGFATELESSLQKVLDDAPVAQATPGITAAVVTPDGVWTGSAGRSADGKPLAPSATFALADVTQTFTAAEVMLLAERGQVDLDAKLSSYVELPVTDLGPTVLDALGMRSGIPNFYTDRLVRDQLRRPDRHVTTEEMLALVPDEPSPPNVRNAYSSTNYLLLGQLIEKVTGEQFADVVRQDLTGPLQLQPRFVVQDQERPRPPMARGDVPGSTTFLPNRSLASAGWAAYGMAGDAESLARWGYSLYGGSVLKPETLRTMLPTSTGGYGLGTGSTRLTYHGLMVVGHGGELPGCSAFLGVQRDNALSIAVLANDDSVRVDLVMDALATVVLEG